MMNKIKEQAQVAIDEADVVIFLVDGKAGLQLLMKMLQIF